MSAADGSEAATVASMSTAEDATVRRRRGDGAHATTIISAARRLIDEDRGTFTTQDLIKEAGVALQTFYRHFESKDLLLLAVITDLIAENCLLFAEQAAALDDPLERLHTYVTTALDSLRAHRAGATPRFITSEHWRLQQLFPAEMAAASQPFAELVRTELDAAEAAGAITSSDHERDALLISTLVMSVYHEYSFLSDDPRVDTVADDVWAFCLAAIGGTDASPRKRRRVGRKR
jgi:TetR/AcrR family transcriptional regulator